MKTDRTGFKPSNHEAQEGGPEPDCLWLSWRPCRFVSSDISCHAFISACGLESPSAVHGLAGEKYVMRPSWERLTCGIAALAWKFSLQGSFPSFVCKPGACWKRRFLSHCIWLDRLVEEGPNPLEAMGSWQEPGLRNLRLPIVHHTGQLLFIIEPCVILDVNIIVVREEKLVIVRSWGLVFHRSRLSLHVVRERCQKCPQEGPLPASASLGAHTKRAQGERKGSQ